MRSSISLCALLVATLLPASALADVAPRPACPKGQHSEYLYGNKCVDDGFHLERDKNGNPITVRNEPRPTPSASASATASPETSSAASTFASAPPSATTPSAPTAAPATTATAAPGPPTPTPPGPRGGSCAITGAADGKSDAMAIALLLAASMLRRRRAPHR